MVNIQEQPTNKIAPPEKINRLRSDFYAICSYLRQREFTRVFLDNRAQVADFYCHRGKMLGIDTSFINTNMGGAEILANWIKAYWRQLEPILSNHPELCDFIIDSRMSDSEMFWGFLLGPMDYIGTEAAYHWGFDPIGVYRSTRSCDPFMTWTKKNEFFAFQRWRNKKLIEEIELADNILALNYDGLPELRLSDYIYDSYRFRQQTFYTCGTDPRVDFDFLMMSYVPKTRERIHYKHCSISDMLIEMVDQDETFDLIYLKDRMSFRLKSIQPLTQAAIALLKPGGKFVFDLRLKHPTSEEYKELFNLHGIELPTIDEVLGLISSTSKNLGLSCSQFLSPVVMRDTMERNFGVIITVIKT